MCVLDNLRSSHRRKLILASLAPIYGDNPAVPKFETMAPKPRTPYAITKLNGEYCNDLFAAEGRLETASLAATLRIFQHL